MPLKWEIPFEIQNSNMGTLLTCNVRDFVGPWKAAYDQFLRNVGKGIFFILRIWEQMGLGEQTFMYRGFTLGKDIL